jgi:hypothetical protein
MERIDTLAFEPVVEIYDMLENASRTVTANISEIDPETRVYICNWQDEVLERIIDFSPVIPVSKNHSIYTPAVQGYRRWSNTELLKDKGLVGYTLANEIGACHVMCFGTKQEDYPYLSALPEMGFLFHNSESESTPGNLYYEHLQEHYADMDTLILHGIYNETKDHLNTYRKLRPDGKVYCGLDMIATG